VFYEVCGEGGDVCKETVADLLSKLQVPVETEASWNVGEGGVGVRFLAVPLQAGFTVYPK